MKLLFRYVVTGKYGGRIRRFKPLSILILANFFPKMNMLSADRWDILVMKEGLLANTSRDAVINPQHQYPFVRPLKLPDLSGHIGLHQILLERNHITQSLILECDNQETPASVSGDNLQPATSTPVAATSSSTATPSSTPTSDPQPRVCPLHPDTSM